MDAASAPNDVPDASDRRLKALTPPASDDDAYSWLGYESAQPHAWISLSQGDEAAALPRMVR